MERKLTAAFAAEGVTLRRAHPYDPATRHGFISSQRMGMDVFMNMTPRRAWWWPKPCGSTRHHVLPGLRSHRGPILTAANWSGQWPGLVGMLNLNGSMYKAGVPFSTIWSLDFTDDFFRRGLRQWLAEGRVEHDASHVRALDPAAIPAARGRPGRATWRDELRRRKAIMGIFDEGCMGMYNAIVEDELLNPLGIYKERLSQSALVARMRAGSRRRGAPVRAWLDKRGVRFVTGRNHETDLTDDQILEQCKMYIAAVRMAHEFGCDLIGIQYQQGLKDMVPASDLAEGLLNNPDRPPVLRRRASRSTPARRCRTSMKWTNAPAWTLWSPTASGPRWASIPPPRCTMCAGASATRRRIDDFVWVFQISGAAPASHFTGGYAGAVSERQPPMYFRLGGGTLKGVSKPGEIVWSRVFVEAARCTATWAAPPW